MDFDASTAKPVVSSGFDPSTAKVEGFDPHSASQIDSRLSAFVNAPDSDVSQTSPVSERGAMIAAQNDQIASLPKDIAPLTSEEIERTMFEPAFLVPESLKEAAANATLLGQLGPRGKEAAKGIQDTLAGAAETALSPGGLAIAGGQFVPGLNVAVDATLAASMAKSGAEKLGEASVTKDLREAAQGATELLLGAAGAGGGIARAIGERRAVLAEKAAAQTPPVIPKATSQTEAALENGKAILTEATDKTAATATETSAPSPTLNRAVTTSTASKASDAEPEFVAGSPTEPFRASDVIGIKNAKVDEQRAARGLEPIMEPLRKSDETLWNQAMGMVERDPGLPDRLTDELLAKPRPLSDAETVVMTRQLAALENDLEQARVDGINAVDAGDEAGRINAKVQETEIAERLSRTERAVGRQAEAGVGGAGTEQGRALRARQLLLRKDYSLAGVERRMRAAQDYKALDSSQLNEARRIAAQWKEAADALDAKLKEKNEALASEQEARKLAELKTQAAEAQAKVTGRVRSIVLKVEKAIENEANAARERLKGRILSVSPEDLKDIAWIAADNLVKLGENLPAWTAKMVETFGEAIRPHLETLWAEAKRLHSEIAQKASDSAEQAKTVARVSKKAVAPEEKRLADYKKRLGNRIADLERRIRERDFAKRQRQPLPVDKEVLALQAQKARVESDFEQALAAKQRAERPTWVKVADALAAWKRAAVLTSLGIFEKLTAAGLWRQALMPAEDIVGSILSKAPGIGKIAERAPIEGGFSLAAEVKGLTEGWTTGLKEAWQKATRGETDLDVLHGHRRPGFEGEQTKWGAVFEPKFLNYAAFLHAALKAPTFRNSYARALTKLTEFDARRGLDVGDPIGQLRRSNEAYEWASRQIFLQDNALVSAYRRFLSRLDEVDKVTKAPNPGLKALSTAIKMELPIVKVPTNIAAEAMEYLTGALTGSVRAASALRRGIDKLPPAEADLIMRQLKKGALGLPAAALVGYLLRDQIGGFFIPGVTHVRGDDGKIHPGEMSIGDTKIGEQDLHSPFMSAVMFGATVGKAADAKVRKKDYEPQGVWNGLLAASLGLADQTPFYREIADLAALRDPRERERILGQRVTSMLVPGGVSYIARHMDTKSGESFSFNREDLVQRQPRTVGENLEAAIPGFRQNVPVKKQRR